MTTQPTDTRDATIDLTGLSKVYGTGADQVVAVDGIDLTVDRGEVFGFLGPNGAGKSTTINMLLGFTSPTAGSASILGADTERRGEELRRQIGVLPEGLGLYERLTGRRHLEFAIEWKDADDDPDRLLERVGLDQDDAERRLGEYSKGMQQRLALAMALVGSPAVLLLDEPSSGLDPHGISRLQKIVRQERDRGATVLFSSHILGQVEAVCDRVGILHEGSLVAVDTIEGLRTAVGSGSELQIRLADERSVAVSHVDGVAAVEQAAGTVRVQVDDPRAKGRVVSSLMADGHEILDIDSSKAALEDVFAAYTGGVYGEQEDTNADRKVLAQ